MKKLSFLMTLSLITWLASSCSYAPPPRSYILAKESRPLKRRASSLEFALAKAIFQHAQQCAKR